MDTILRRVMDEGAGPKYKRLVDGISQAIEEGVLTPSDKLPPVRELAWRLEITPGTVARAFTILAEEGKVISEVGRGTFVSSAANPVEWPNPEPKLDPVLRARLEPLQPLYLDLPKEGDVLFAPRLPDVGQLTLVREGLRQVAEADPRSLLSYPSWVAQADVRASTLPWLPTDMRPGVTGNDVVMTNGGQAAIMACLQALITDDAPVVLVEATSYPGLRRAADLLRARVVAVPMDDEGVLPEALDEVARQENTRVLFTMPEVHNPTCTVTSPARREAVAEVARRRGLHLIQDDCYRLGPPTGPSYRRLVPELGWYVSSMSKAISPGLRVGFAVAPKGMAKRLRRVVDANYFGVAVPMVQTTRYVLSHPDAPGYVDAMRQHVRDYLAIALNVLGRFDLGWAKDVPFFWLRLPEGWREGSFVQALEAQGIRVRPGSDFGARDARALHAVRISVNGHMSPERFRAVLGRIAELLDNPPDRAGV